MLLRYRAVTALTLAAACILFPATRTSAAGRHKTPSHRAAAPPRASQIYSARALRQARIILQLKLLELRAERLERVRKALEHHLPLKELLQM